jgi:hypothetical protein
MAQRADPAFGRLALEIYETLDTRAAGPGTPSGGP